MKQISILLLILAAIFFNSCSDDSIAEPVTPAVDPNAPTVKIISPENYDGIEENSEVMLTLSMKTKTALIDSINIFLDDSLCTTYLDPQVSADDTLRYCFLRIPAHFTGTHKFSAVVKDKNGLTGKSAEVAFKIVTGYLVFSGQSSFGNIMPGLTSQLSFTVSGYELQSDLLITVPDGFEVSENPVSGFSSSIAISATNGIINEKTVYLNFKPAEVKNYSGFIRMNAVNGATLRVAVQGTGITPQPALSAGTRIISFGYTAAPGVSAAKVFTVAGVVLNGDINISVPTGFTISTAEDGSYAPNLNLAPVNGSVPATNIYIRFKPSVAQIYSGNIAISSTGIEAKNIKVYGIALPTVPAMIAVDGGTFQMGDDNYGSLAHPVTLSSYKIGKFEVTQAEWLATMGNNPCDSIDNLTRPVERVCWYDILVFCNLRSINEGLTPCYSINGSTNPANWGDIPSFSDENWDSVICNWSANGYRLPTEAEWEFAARGGNSSHNYDYSGSNYIGEVAWFEGNSGNITHPVGTKAPNELGIYDMSGNEREWNWDRRGDYSTEAQTNPTGPVNGSSRIMRGGSCRNELNLYGYCQVDARDGGAVHNRYKYSGFRVVRSN